MAHFANIDENNIVTNVIVIHNDYETNGKDYINNVLGLSGTWIQTSYHSYRGLKHVQYVAQVKDQKGNLTNKYVLSATNQFGLRFNYAGIGFTYDPTLDAFIPPKPFNSYVLNLSTCQWEAPVPIPADAGRYGGPNLYNWNESTLSWDLIGDGDIYSSTPPASGS